MKVVMFGATGMVGQGVLRECLLAADVELVLLVGRTASGVQHLKVREIVQADLWDYSAVESELTGFDACFFCLGVSAAGMKPSAYERITFGITIIAGETLSRLNPLLTFVYVSGAGTDGTERGRMMWARVKGKTENTLARLPFKAAYMFRPGVIEPLHGARSKTASYRFFYAIGKPLLPLLRRMFPDSILTTEEIGRAMLTVARRGAPKWILESRDIRAVARS